MVNDLDPAVKFYSMYLGFRVERESKPNFATLERGNLELVLSTPFGPGGSAKPMPDGRKPEPGGWNRIIINFDDLKAEVARLKEADLMATGGGTRVWKGYVTDTWCGLNRVDKAPTAECTLSCVENRHAQYAFFNFADKKVYVLNPQSLAAKFAGQTLAVKGTVGGRVTFATMKGPATGAIITASSITQEAR